MQKAIYLAQASGVNLGYFYHWYLHGPYSSTLTRDEFAIAMGISADLDESKGWSLDDASSQRLRKLQGLFTEPKRDELARKLELLASVHFLIDRKQVSGVNTRQITETLRRFKKDFSEENVKEALEELRKYGLLQS